MSSPRAIARSLSLLGWALVTGSLSCAPEIKHVDAATQIMLRIDSSSKDLRARFSALNVAVARLQETQAGGQEDSWSQPTQRVVERALIKKWPVDIPLTPGGRDGSFAQFEVVVEALNGLDLIAQTRAVSSFVPGERRVLELHVEPCTGKPTGFVCSDSACHGPNCDICDPSGACVPVGLTDPRSLSSLDAIVPTGASVDAGRRDAAVSRDASVESDPESGLDAADAGGDPPAAEPGAALAGSACTQPDAERCAISGTTMRVRCQDGTWAATDPCSDNEICTAGNDPGSTTCRPLVGLCKGNAGKPTCDGATMLFCDAQALVERTLICPSSTQCMLGLANSSCAACTPGAFRCTGASLEKCAADGQSFVAAAPGCASAELCNATAGACTKEACLPDSKMCAGDVLRGCNDAQTGFADEKTCKAGLCDAAGKQCDECVANSKTCDGNSVKTCDAQGQGYSTSACPSTKPLCTGNGTCVQCQKTSDCPLPASDCAVAMCNAASGTCTTTNKPAQSACDAGICDGNGTCGPRPTCGDGVVNQASEQCDDGNNGDDNDYCLTGCHTASCGDGHVNRSGGHGTAAEECDIGAKSIGNDKLQPGTIYDKYNCDASSCKRRFTYTACQTSSDCAGAQLTQMLWQCNTNIGVCYANCSSSSTCSDPSGQTGSCYMGFCMLRCGAVSDTPPDCPPGWSCQLDTIGGSFNFCTKK